MRVLWDWLGCSAYLPKLSWSLLGLSRVSHQLGSRLGLDGLRQIQLCPASSLVLSRLVWAYSHTCSRAVSGFQKGKAKPCEVSWNLALEEAHHPFCHVPLGKINLRSNLDSRTRDIDSQYIELQRHIAKNMSTGRGAEWHHVVISILHRVFGRMSGSGSFPTLLASR